MLNGIVHRRQLEINVLKVVFVYRNLYFLLVKCEISNLKYSCKVYLYYILVMKRDYD
jgi:hypothetical protein